MGNKIMMVDDMDICNFILKKMIRNISTEFELYDFTDPEDAINQLPIIQPDLIFLDINMPGMNGWEFLEAMRQAGNGLPVYMLTSSTSDIDKRRAAQYANVVRMLTKPLPKDELSEILYSIPMLMQHVS